jgi:hypothetical protein
MVFKKVAKNRIAGMKLMGENEIKRPSLIENNPIKNRE